MDPRKILGVSNDATLEEIQKAYREKARKHHPDLGGDSWAFQQVQEAFQALTDSTSNSASDASDAGQSERSNSKPVTPEVPVTVVPSAANAGEDSTAGESDSIDERGSALSFFTRQLPLQQETTTFILANCLDIFVTYMLLQFGQMPGAKFRGVESNPIANFFMGLWGFNGMIAFKLFIVAMVCLIAQIVATQNMRLARGLLYVGTALVAAVVVYSLILFGSHFT